jgi:hypothetical protein
MTPRSRSISYRVFKIHYNYAYRYISSTLLPARQASSFVGYQPKSQPHGQRQSLNTWRKIQSAL